MNTNGEKLLVVNTEVVNFVCCSLWTLKKNHMVHLAVESLRKYKMLLSHFADVSKDFWLFSYPDSFVPFFLTEPCVLGSSV